LGLELGLELRLGLGLVAVPVAVAVTVTFSAVVLVAVVVVAFRPFKTENIDVVGAALSLLLALELGLLLVLAGLCCSLGRLELGLELGLGLEFPLFPVLFLSLSAIFFFNRSLKEGPIGLPEVGPPVGPLRPLFMVLIGEG
jgi:hypothetical protein